MPLQICYTALDVILLPCLGWYSQLLLGYVRKAKKTISASLEQLAHCQNVVSLNLSCAYHFSRGSSELPKLVQLRYLYGRPTCLSNSLHDFSVAIP